MVSAPALGAGGREFESPLPDSVANTRREAWIGVVVAVAAVGVWLARAPFAVDSLWAEDGRNWLQDAVQDGWFTSFGRADAGYYHSLPRVGGAIASWVPLEQAAAAMWIFGAVVVAWMAITVYVSSRAWIEHPLARATLALALVLLPVQREETIGSVANLHFMMLFVGLVVLIGEPRSTTERVNGWCVLALLGLSSPIALALVPFAAWRVFRQRPWRPDGFVVAWLVGVVVQFGAILVFDPTRPSSDGTSGSSIAARYVTGVIAENFSPTDRAARAIGLLLGAAFVIGVGVAVVVAARRRDLDRALLLVVVPLTGVGAFVVSSAGYGARFRYAIFPALCLLWAGLCALQVLARVDRAPGWASESVVFTAVAALVFVAWVPHWSAGDYRRSGPTWTSGLTTAAQTCTRTGADEVEVVIRPTDLPPGRSWSVRVDCAAAVAARGA